jgi:ATP-dependent Lon protease
VTSKGIRESGRMAYDYLRATGKKIGIDRDLGEYDVNVQVMSLTQGKDAADLGMALYIALLSAILGRQIGAQLVVLGVHRIFLAYVCFTSGAERDQNQKIKNGDN